MPTRDTTFVTSGFQLTVTQIEEPERDQTFVTSDGQLTVISAGEGGGGDYTPSLDFSDARNSQYIGQVV